MPEQSNDNVQDHTDEAAEPVGSQIENSLSPEATANKASRAASSTAQDTDMEESPKGTKDFENIDEVSRSLLETIAGQHSMTDEHVNIREPAAENASPTDQPSSSALHEEPIALQDPVESEAAQTKPNTPDIQRATSDGPETNALPGLPQSQSQESQEACTVLNAKQIGRKESRSISVDLPREVTVPEVNALLPSSLFDRFKRAYPEYAGDVRHFQASCTKIAKLSDEVSIMPQYMWDDFIVKHKMEYLQYIQRCAECFEIPLPYERYYTTMVEAPTFIKGIVTARNLQEGSKPSAPTSEHGDELIRMESPEIEVSPSFERPSSRISASNDPTPNKRPTRSIPTIDLTLDDEPLELPRARGNQEPTRAVSKKERRSLPWMHEAGGSKSDYRHSIAG